MTKLFESGAPSLKSFDVLGASLLFFAPSAFHLKSNCPMYFPVFQPSWLIFKHSHPKVTSLKDGHCILIVYIYLHWHCSIAQIFRPLVATIHPPLQLRGRPWPPRASHGMPTPSYSLNFVFNGKSSYIECPPTCSYPLPSNICVAECWWWLCVRVFLRHASNLYRAKIRTVSLIPVVAEGILWFWFWHEWSQHR